MKQVRANHNDVQVITQLLNLTKEQFSIEC